MSRPSSNLSRSFLTPLLGDGHQKWENAQTSYRPGHTFRYRSQPLQAGKDVVTIRMWKGSLLAICRFRLLIFSILSMGVFLTCPGFNAKTWPLLNQDKLIFSVFEVRQVCTFAMGGHDPQQIHSTLSPGQAAALTRKGILHRKQGGEYLLTKPPSLGSHFVATYQWQYSSKFFNS